MKNCQQIIKTANKFLSTDDNLNEITQHFASTASPFLDSTQNSSEDLLDLMNKHNYNVNYFSFRNVFYTEVCNKIGNL